MIGLDVDELDSTGIDLDIHDFNIVLNLDVGSLDELFDSGELTEWSYHRSRKFIENAPEIYNCRYRIKNTGRLYELGLSIQSLPSVVRDKILPFEYSYDFGSASISYYSSLLENNNLDHYYLDLYIENKDYIRNYFSEKLGISVKKVKQVIAALTFGMSALMKNGEVYRSDKPIKSLILLLGDKKKYYDLMTNEFFYHFVKEIQTAHAIVMKEGFLYDYQTKNRLFFKDMNTKKIGKKRLCALAYQSFESWYMGLLIEKLGLNREEYYTVHDCIYCNIPPEIMKLTFAEVNDDTNLKMSY